MDREQEQPHFDEADDDRRSFFARLSIALSALIGAALSLPVVGFIVAPVFTRPSGVWRRVGEARPSMSNFKTPRPSPGQASRR